MESHHVFFPEVHQGELVGFKVDDFDSFAFRIPEVRGKKEEEGGFTAATLLSVKTECLHYFVSFIIWIMFLRIFPDGIHDQLVITYGFARNEQDVRF